MSKKRKKYNKFLEGNSNKMKKNNIVLFITVIIICIILVSVMLIRFKAVEKTDFAVEESKIESELRTEIVNYKEKYDEAIEEINQVSQRKAEYEEQIEKNDTNVELIINEIKQTDNLLGKTNVKGDGVVVTLEDNEQEKIVESDISELINELKYAGAEAISINNIRLEILSDVSSTSNNILILDGQKLLSPYVIKAIRKSKLFI